MMERDIKSDAERISDVIQTNKEHYEIINFLMELCVAQIRIKIGSNKFPTGNPPISWYFDIMKSYPVESLMQSAAILKHLNHGSITFEIHVSFENMESIVQKCRIDRRHAQFVFKMTQYGLNCDLDIIANRIHFTDVLTKYCDRIYDVPKVNSTVTKLTSIIKPIKNSKSESKQVYYTFSNKIMERYDSNVQERNMRFYNWLINEIDTHVVNHKREVNRKSNMRDMLINSGNKLQLKLAELENIANMTMASMPKPMPLPKVIAGYNKKANKNFLDAINGGNTAELPDLIDCPASNKKRDNKYICSSQSGFDLERNVSNTSPTPSSSKPVGLELIDIDNNQMMQYVFNETDKKLRILQNYSSNLH